MSTAKEVLGLETQKGVGGMIGAFSRKAARFGFEMPFSAGKSSSGQRMWTWKPSVAKALGIPEPAE